MRWWSPNCFLFPISHILHHITKSKTTTMIVLSMVSDLSAQVAFEGEWMVQSSRILTSICNMYVCIVLYCTVILWYVMLCCVTLRHFLSYYVMCCGFNLSYAMLCYVMLCSVLFCSIMLCYVMLCNVMYIYICIHMQYAFLVYSTSIHMHMTSEPVFWWIFAINAHIFLHISTLVHISNYTTPFIHHNAIESPRFGLHLLSLSLSLSLPLKVYTLTVVWSTVLFSFKSSPHWTPEYPRTPL